MEKERKGEKTAEKTSDEFEELPDFGRKPTLKKRVIYALLSLEAVLAAAFLFVRIFLVDVKASQVTLVLAVGVNTLLLSFAYHNLSFAKAARIRRLANPPTKGSFKGRKEDYDAALSAFEQKINQAALWHSCAVNNVIFLLFTPLLGVYLLSEKLSGDLNLLVAGAMSAGLAVFNSNTALNAIGETH